MVAFFAYHLFIGQDSCSYLVLSTTKQKHIAQLPVAKSFGQALQASKRGLRTSLETLVVGLRCAVLLKSINQLIVYIQNEKQVLDWTSSTCSILIPNRYFMKGLLGE